MSTSADCEEIDVLIKNVESTLDIVKTIAQRIKERNRNK